MPRQLAGNNNVLTYPPLPRHHRVVLAHSCTGDRGNPRPRRRYCFRNAMLPGAGGLDGGDTGDLGLGPDAGGLGGRLGLDGLGREAGRKGVDGVGGGDGGRDDEDRGGACDGMYAVDVLGLDDVPVDGGGEDGGDGYVFGVLAGDGAYRPEPTRNVPADPCRRPWKPSGMARVLLYRRYPAVNGNSFAASQTLAPSSAFPMVTHNRLSCRIQSCVK